MLELPLYRCLDAIPSIGARTGDYVVCRADGSVCLVRILELAPGQLAALPVISVSGDEPSGRGRPLRGRRRRRGSAAAEWSRMGSRMAGVPGTARRAPAV